MFTAEMEFILRDGVHEVHDQAWRLYSDLHDCEVCLGCVVEIIEKRDLLPIQRKPALSELLRLLSCQSEYLLQLFIEEERIVWHIVSLLFGNFLISFY